MAYSESLFSFEVAIDYLCIDVTTVACRFPVMAVRLLDFPSLLIPQLDKVERKRFKTSILLDAHGKLPFKFKDLLDSKGNFQFNKGKSCMFKFDLNKLHEHLHTVPLYVMVTDLWGDAAKLVGICTIPLNMIISDIKKDVEDSGISYPSMHGHQDIFPVFNLMGSRVGSVSLGYRLLSLGQSLMSHIPTASIQRKPEQTHGNGLQSDLISPKQQDILNEVQESIQTNDQVDLADVHNQITEQQFCGMAARNQKQNHESVTSFQNQMSSSNIVKQSTSKRIVNQQTQTFQKKENKQFCKKEKNVKIEQSDDIVINNTHCPPPLFFNAKCDNHIHVTSTTSPKEYLFVENKSSVMEQDLSQSESSESYYSKTMEVHYKLENNTPENIRKVVKQSNNKLSQRTKTPDDNIVKQFKTKGDSKRLNHGHLPILTALLQELSLLTGTKAEHPDALDYLVREGKENVQPSAEKKKPFKMATPHRDPIDLVPTHGHHPQSCRHKLCAKPPKPVPSAKGWLRQEPVFGKRGTKLQFKMTYSQKLRLKKNNPELLKAIEAEEQKHTVQVLTTPENIPFQSKTRKNKKRIVQRPTSEPSLYCEPPDVPTEVSRQSQECGATSHRGDKSLTSARNLIPSPKTSVSSLVGLTGISNADENDPPMQVIKEFHRKTRLPNLEDNDISASEKSVRSIEVFIPNPVLLDSGSEDETSVHDVSEDLKQKEKEAGLAFPGFSVSSLEGAVEDMVSSRQSFRASYSQEFESVQGGSNIYSDNFDDSVNSCHTPKDGDCTPSAEEGEERQSRTSQSSVGSSQSVLDSGKSSKSRSYRDSSGESRVDDEKRVDLSKQFNFEKEKFKKDARIERISPKSVRGGLALPQPPLSASSPVPQQRHPPSKIVLSKPVSVNEDQYDTSGEVNLPSDLSSSFDLYRPKTSRDSFDSSLEGVRVSRLSERQKGLDDIKSETEPKDSNEYSEDVMSDLGNSDD